MSQSDGSAGGMKRRRRPEFLVPFIGLIYVVLVMLRVLMVDFVPAPIFVPFMILFLISAYGVWRGSRFGYVLSAVVSGIFLVADGANAPISAVTIPEAFVSAITAISVLAGVFVYSILGARMTWKTATQARPIRMIPASSLVILLVLGFICGALFVGFIVAGAESRLVASAGGGDITMVTGAGNQNNGQFFSPASFTVKAGTTVTWVNHDGIDHTVTSKGSSIFDSGNVPTGGTFSYKFTTAGTYQYYCTIHPWMTGTVVVTP